MSSRGKFSDRDADAYAIRKVREWRHDPRDAMQIGRLNWQLIANDSFTVASCIWEELNYDSESRK
ncbi:MAG: hypothetical protein ACRD8Z_14775 [Nitrososphaeraceae archaeon]